MEEFMSLALGEMGGVFGVGCLAGYVFCFRTLLKETKEKVNSLEERLDRLRAQYTVDMNDLRDKYEHMLTEKLVEITNARSTTDT